MRKNFKFSLTDGVSIVILMLLLPVFNSCTEKGKQVLPTSSDRAVIVLAHCAKPLPCPGTLDTGKYTVPLGKNLSYLDFCFNLPSSDVSHITVTLSGADSVIKSGVPEIIGDSLVISGEMAYPAIATFTLGQKLGNVLRFNLTDNSGDTEKHFTLDLILYDKP